MFITKTLFYFLLIYYFTIANSVKSGFEQDYTNKEYELVAEFINASWYNTSYAEDLTLIVNRYNRSVLSIKAHGLLKVPIYEAFVKGRLFVFRNNEFKYSGIEKMMDLCNVLKHNYFGAEIVKKQGNITDCPLMPNYYGLFDLVIDPSKFPPLIPAGRYKADIDVYVGKKKELAAYGYFIGRVEYFDKLKKRT